MDFPPMEGWDERSDPAAPARQPRQRESGRGVFRRAGILLSSCDRMRSPATLWVAETRGGNLLCPPPTV